MKQNRLYDEFAHMWPLISPPHHYAEEASYWREALRDKLGPGRHEILELGVGGGHNLSHLTAEFDATAVDLSEKMLANSRRLNPGVEHHVGDMRTVRLERTFDAVLIHDAIGYMLTEDDLRATFATARAHLRPGGLFITTPDDFAETFPGTWVSHHSEKRDDLEFTFIEYNYDADPDDNTVQSVFFYIWNEGGELTIEQDFHVTSLYPIATWERLMSEAGFRVEKRPYPVHEDGRDAYMLVGVT